jgi:RimJ/RimL family protein N-acetyltransferase
VPFVDPAPESSSEGQTFLTGPNLYLRAARLTDAATAAIWRGSPFPAPVEVVEQELRERFDRGMFAEEREQLLIACRRDNGQPVGSVDMRMNGWRNPHLHFAVDPLATEDQRDATLAQMIEIVVSWTIDERDAMTLEFVTPAGQPRVEEAVRRLNGRAAVRLRDFRLVNGERRDEIWHQCFNPRWAETLGMPPEPVEGPVERLTRSPARRTALADSGDRPPDAFVVGERLVLRAFRPEDAESIEAWSLQETEIVFPEGRWVVNAHAYQRSFTRNAKHEPPERISFIIALRDTGEPIGVNAIQEINWITRTAETMTELFRPEHRGAGFGTEAKHLLLEYAFERLGLHAVYAYVSETNPRSAAALRKQGYRDAGYIAWDAFGPDGLCGAWAFDLLADEWRDAREKNEGRR